MLTTTEQDRFIINRFDDFPYSLKEFTPIDFQFLRNAIEDDRGEFPLRDYSSTSIT